MPKNESIHSMIINYITNLIETGEKKPGDKLPTENELAQFFGTSRTTVLRALDKLLAQGIIYKRRGSGSYVSEKKSDNSPKIISIIFPTAQNQELKEMANETSLIRGCQNYLSKKGYMLTISYANRDFEEECEIVRQCKENCAQGIILYPSTNIDSMSGFYNLILDHVPIVFIDNPLNFQEGCYVLSDNKSGGYIGGEHLIEVGCDVLFFVSEFNVASHGSMQDRYYGFCKALQTHRIPISYSQCFALSEQLNNFSTMKEMYVWMLEQILSVPGKKHGIFCTTDDTAFDFLDVASEMGIRVPDQLAIIGYGSALQSSDIHTKMTSVQQDYYSIGENAAKELYKMIGDPQLASMYRTKYIPVTLSKGQTT